MEEVQTDEYAIIWRIEEHILPEIAISNNNLEFIEGLFEKLKLFEGLSGYSEGLSEPDLNLIATLEDNGLIMSRTREEDMDIHPGCRDPYYPEITALSIVRISKVV